MPTIPLMAYNVFTAMDQTYWTGFPTAENPYANPVTNWGNSRYMFVRLKPAEVKARRRPRPCGRRPFAAGRPPHPEAS